MPPDLRMIEMDLNDGCSNLCAKLSNQIITPRSDIKGCWRTNEHDLYFR